MFNQNQYKLNNIKSEFTIKDLENLSGIKAHTIRIWEKRYSLLHPERTDGNIRFYDLENLQKLLNVVFLIEQGHKISKVASLSNEAIVLLAREYVNAKAINDNAVNALKISMFSFDAVLFNKTYNQLLLNKTFGDVFKNVFIPFLNHIGFLWQTQTINPANEHFASNLIAQKIHINIERLQQNSPTDTSKTFVLFLPEGEIHELGLLFLYYELLLRGHKVVYLGQSIPMDNIESLLEIDSQVNFVSSFTVVPMHNQFETYLDGMQKLLSNSSHEYWIFGFKVVGYNKEKYPFKFYDGLLDLLKEL
ncbi:MerR family transcriptional regulator [Polaribacter pacificus]|uniref:MerR family transcriptional regulator n=1 Tax=Polaribacter pacificus TaxID=1775173 RepID=A0A917MEF4_9FLAO|nr:MerR family transcriptional regulator [Polaribacter pacificus]